MRLWRIASARYPALDGEGARLWGGRWNSPGRPVVYASTTAALAVLEKLVWVDPEDVPNDLHLYEIEVPDDAAPELVQVDRLPPDWTDAGASACREIGDAWLAAGTSLALSVPSALVPPDTRELNVLLNPRHAAAGAVRQASARPFAFDLRLVR
jgi:RES domain-containing protein